MSRLDYLSCERYLEPSRLCKAMMDANSYPTCATRFAVIIVGSNSGSISTTSKATNFRSLIAQMSHLVSRLSARDAIWREFAKLHREVLAFVKADEACRLLMTAPGVGAVVSLTFRATVDDPSRFAKSKAVGAFFSLTPKRYQSGETDVVGGITRVGDASMRSALHDAANVILFRVTRFSTLKSWARQVAKRRGMRRAKVALARKLATVLHRIWVDGTEFMWGQQPATEAA